MDTNKTKKKRPVLLWIVLICTLSLAIYNYYPDKGLPDSSRIDLLVVHKSKRQMEAYADGQLIKTYTIALGSKPVGAKAYEGDKRTPEGIYTINDKNENSGYHKNLGISYPNAKDIANAKKLGKPPGGDIKIHGLRNGLGLINKWHRWLDWTAGCIALTNSEVDELYRAVPTGTKIDIRP